VCAASPFDDSSGRRLVGKTPKDEVQSLGGTSEALDSDKKK
jgi:hypothetical protein